MVLLTPSAICRICSQRSCKSAFLNLLSLFCSTTRSENIWLSVLRPLDRIGFAGLRFPPKLHWNFVLKKVSRVPTIGFHWHFNKYFPPETILWLDKYETVVVRGEAVSHVSPLQAYRVVDAIERNSNFLSILYARIFFFNSRGWTFSLTCVPPFFWPIPTNWPNIGFKNRVTTALGIFSNSRSRFYNKIILMYHVSRVS